LCRNICWVKIFTPGKKSRDVLARDEVCEILKEIRRHNLTACEMVALLTVCGGSAND
jgi:hypothetical protein